MYEAVIFDLDGTLTNTLKDIADSMERVLKRHGLPGHNMQEYRYMVGNGARTLARRAVGEHSDMEDAVYADYMEEYGAHKLDSTAPYPGVPEMLQALADLGVKLCVLSNKPHRDSVAVVKHFFPRIPFAAVQGQITGIPVKPDPTGAKQIAAKLGITASDFLYLGDSYVDIECALKAGMTPVGALWGFRDREELQTAGARYLIARPMELLPLVDSGLGG